ncbi:LysR family transcriptional regulator [uncultured Alsobacter sp.]|uniref:LysR family transcriptional regulator n=1 Tax=uncultured Alsobacter sp. TaxID=1748258 RepID=UPI0025CC9EF6|nr:LysR family transcriptional regulator [uncultured Alsobacter sp.]
MDRLQEMEVFVTVADAGSFAGAGARMRISPPAVTRAIASLEDRLGGRLFNRTTRSLSLTEAGARFLESARRLLADVEEAEKAAVGETAIPHGHLTITASVTFGRSALAPVVSAYFNAHPRVSASVVLLDRVVNLVEEGFDVAVRIAPMPDSGLMARRIGEIRRVLVASPDYLARRGRPQVPADLKQHAFIAFTPLLPNREWRYTDARGTNSVTLAPRFEINDAVAAIKACEAGDGITIALSYMVAEAVRAGRLVTVLDEVTPPPVPVHLVHAQSRLVAPKIRSFVDFSTPLLRATLQALTIGPTDA